MDTRLKDSEWIILQALWEKAPLDLKGIIAHVQKNHPAVGWDYKTYHSFLRIRWKRGMSPRSGRRRATSIVLLLRRTRRSPAKPRA